MNHYLSKMKNRRRAVKTIIRTLIQIHDIELKYYLSLPDTAAYEVQQNESGHIVDALNEIIDSLH